MAVIFSDCNDDGNEDVLVLVAIASEALWCELQLGRVGLIGVLPEAITNCC